MEKQKQKVVVLSSAKGEFQGTVKGFCELFWLKMLLIEIGFAFSSEMYLFQDNKAATVISHNSVQHDCTNHVDVDEHIIEQNLDEKVVWFPLSRQKTSWWTYSRRSSLAITSTTHSTS